jgi:hypothetical protein
MADYKPVRNANTTVAQQSETIFKQETSYEKQKQEHHVLRQDKRALQRARMRLDQPAPPENVMRAHGTDNNIHRSQNYSTPTRQTAQVTLWVKPIVKAELARLAAQEGLTMSAAGAALLEKAVQTNIDMKYGPLLEPVIERILTKLMNARDSRIISLLVRIAFDSGQTRSIVTNILGLQPDISPELLRDIIAESDKRAKSNIMKKTPQITELTEALENW